VIKGALFLICLPFAAGDFHAPTGDNGGGHQVLVWIVIGSVLVIAIVLAVVTLVPRVRRLATEKARPHLATIWKHIKARAIALCLGASLHAVGKHASFVTIIVVLTLASMIGGAAPIPGGAGVIEVGLIAGLTAAGVPQDQAVAAVFIERLCTAYLPPIWGWATPVWMRRSVYV
jgi:uncharacterized membrane protein YbhN (UPF0104 family)